MRARAKPVGSGEHAAADLDDDAPHAPQQRPLVRELAHATGSASCAVAGGSPRAAATAAAMRRTSSRHALAGGAGDGAQRRCRARRSAARTRRERVARLGQVELVGDHDLRLRRERPALASASSRLMTSKSSSGSRPLSPRDVEQVDQHGRAREVAQEAVPSPWPSCAPSIRPGMSASTKLRSSSTRTTPRCGTSVVNG